jgi:hypothetical protein
MVVAHSPIASFLYMVISLGVQMVSACSARPDSSLGRMSAPVATTK